MVGVLAHLGYAFARVVGRGAVIGAPFPTPMVGAAGVAVAAGRGVVLAWWARLRCACLVSKVRCLPREILFGVEEMRLYLLDR